jgi:hypothetical protein
MSPCAKCGQLHITRHGGPACTGHISTGPRAGQPCTNSPIHGAQTCRYHGGAAPQVRAAAAARLAEQAADQALRRGLADAYGANVPDVDPADAMLRAVSWKHAEVLALRVKVAELDDDQRVWGVTKDTPGDQGGLTSEAKPHIWWQMLRTAEAQLVQFAKDARAAGCDERRVKLAEDQGEIVVGLLRRILDGLFQRLVEAGVPEGLLREAWDAAVSDVVPRELRAAAIGGV